MDSRQLAAILSSLISQLTLLIILLFPNSNHSQFPISNSQNPNSQTLFSLLHHFLSSSETLTLSLLTRTRKRTRTHIPEPETHHGQPSTRPKLGRLGRVDSFNSGPDSFPLFYKMSSSTFEWLSGLLEPLLECRDPVNLPLHGISPELRLGIGLFRLVTGSSYSQLADRFGVTDRVAKFCTKHLCRVLCTNFRFWVGFPNQSEIKPVNSSFEELTGLPNCCGVIGCTRFDIDDTNSIAAQIVVDSSCRIMNIVAGFNGNKSNIEILKSSTLFKDIESGTLLNGQSNNINQVNVPQYLVGDKGYPLLPWLMTPFDHVLQGSNDEEKLFNHCHELITRVSIRKTIASLKNWGILSKPIEEEYKDGIAYIGSCAILHNALLLREDYSGLCDADNSIEDYIGYDHDHDHDSSMEANSDHGYVIRSALASKAKRLSGF